MDQAVVRQGFPELPAEELPLALRDWVPAQEDTDVGASRGRGRGRGRGLGDVKARGTDLDQASASALASAASPQGTVHVPGHANADAGAGASASASAHPQGHPDEPAGQLLRCRELPSAAYQSARYLQVQAPHLRPANLRSQAAAAAAAAVAASQQVHPLAHAPARTLSQHDSTRTFQLHRYRHHLMHRVQEGPRLQLASQVPHARQLRQRYPAEDPLGLCHRLLGPLLLLLLLVRNYPCPCPCPCSSSSSCFSWTISSSSIPRMQGLALTLTSTSSSRCLCPSCPLLPLSRPHPHCAPWQRQTCLGELWLAASAAPLACQLQHQKTLPGRQKPARFQLQHLPLPHRRLNPVHRESLPTFPEASEARQPRDLQSNRQLLLLLPAVPQVQGLLRGRLLVPSHALPR